MRFLKSLANDNDVMVSKKDIEILYEDTHILVIDKPVGVLVHPDGTHNEWTISDWIQEHYPDLVQVGEEMTLKNGEVIARPGIVHRLDRETSGVLVITKTQESFEHLKRAFQERKVHKTYKAFVYGKLPEEEGEIDRPIGKSKKDFRLWSAQRGARGTLREAYTEYRVEQEAREASYITLMPKTGRTHQLRVHMKAIHHPIVCDSLYAPKHDCLVGFNRLALHAWRIAFSSSDGRNIIVEAPLPKDFEEALSKLS